MAALEGLFAGEQVAIGIDTHDGAAVGAGATRVRLIALRLKLMALRRCVLIPGVLRNGLCLCEATVRMLWVALRSRPRVVHCHDVVYLHAGVLVKLLCGSKLVYDAHELESCRNGAGRALSLCVYWVERGSWAFVDGLVSVSPGIIEWYAREMGPKPAALVMNSPMVEQEGSGLGIARGSDRYFHARYSLHSEDIVVVYLGGFCKGRGIEVFIDAVRRCSAKIHFVLVGFGSMLDVARLANGCERIHLHEAVPHERVVEIVRAADYGMCLIEDVSLSDRLSLPNKLFEYAFAGIPVIASRLPEIRRVVEKHGLGVCCDNDVASVTRLLDTLVSRDWVHAPSNLAQLGWEEQTRRLVNLYTELLAPPEGRKLS
jgi:glycosyltransferase involved in cell wall biosynthesis